MTTPKVWEVVGGVDKGGIIVRAGKEVQSDALDRISTGAYLLQLALVDDRLQYEKLSGSGPQTGWVSLKLKEKELCVLSDNTLIALHFMNPMSREPELICDFYGVQTSTVGMIKMLCCRRFPGLKDKKMIPIRVKKGERESGGVTESPKLDENDTLQAAGLDDGDEFAFVYMGNIKADFPNSSDGTSGVNRAQASNISSSPASESVKPQGSSVGASTTASNASTAASNDDRKSGVQLWRVVGGGDNGGIIVRAGEDKKSDALNRISTDAIVAQLALNGERLQYEKITGSGPQTGWVSIKLGEKDLLVKSDREPVVLDFMSPVDTDENGNNLFYCKLYVLPEMTVADVKALCAVKTGCKPTCMIPAKAKFGMRISEGDKLSEKLSVQEVGYEDIDNQFAFIYTGTYENDLKPRPT